MSAMSDQLLPKAFYETASERVWTPTVSIAMSNSVQKFKNWIGWLGDSPPTMQGLAPKLQ